MVMVNAMGDACPIPVIKTKKAIQALTEPDTIEVLVDNEIAVQNLEKMCRQKEHGHSYERIDQNCYLVRITRGASETIAVNEVEEDLECEDCTPNSRIAKGLVVALTADVMGGGDDTLGHALMKGFVYALTEQDRVPETVVLYNGGAKLSVEGSESLEDLRILEEQGTEIMTCGTCLNHYELTEKLAVGSVTNMYQIVEVLTGARKVVRP